MPRQRKGIPTNHQVISDADKSITDWKQLPLPVLKLKANHYSISEKHSVTTIAHLLYEKFHPGSNSSITTNSTNQDPNAIVTTTSNTTLTSSSSNTTNSNTTDAHHNHPSPAALHQEIQELRELVQHIVNNQNPPNLPIQDPPIHQSTTHSITSPQPPLPPQPTTSVLTLPPPPPSNTLMNTDDHLLAQHEYVTIDNPTYHGNNHPPPANAPSHTPSHTLRTATANSGMPIFSTNINLPVQDKTSQPFYAPPVDIKTLKKIEKGEFVDFESLLPPPPSVGTDENSYGLEFDTTTSNLLVRKHHTKHKIRAFIT